jgi:hypothetical protein
MKHEPYGVFHLNDAVEIVNTQRCRACETKLKLLYKEVNLDAKCLVMPPNFTLVGKCPDCNSEWTIAFCMLKEIHQDELRQDNS